MRGGREERRGGGERKRGGREEERGYKSREEIRSGQRRGEGEVWDRGGMENVRMTR